ncbi:phosphoglycolate phosphatase [Denitratisoma oestradiolicum]|uniref:Phosphoglycolate phosphatase n=1 Tax=Denitratisoma oestradiolicum TaxID=311182 RepID=A0A6S6XST5_9PROT|nr:phosphoglycolate phosphatase [Denitratisoma oestradiolicum]TWO81101.1 phosphoglycolate phosphatase [Denitratisoma oestradiolicum]CAB1367780.1 Phosphoglycolate phosphatase [Denitratisoma oestradiolicum]
MNFPLPIHSVTLDLDGTLLDTAPDLAKAANAMLAELGLPQRSEAQIRDFIGKGIPNLVKRSITFDQEPDAEALARADAAFRRHYAECNGRLSQPYPGVIEGLERFRSLGLKLAIITNKAGAFTEPLVAVSGLASYVEFTIAGDTLPRKKPDPLPLQHACQRMGVPTKFNLHIGDSQNDFHAARAAGCPVFLVPYGYNEGEDVRLLECDAIVASLVHAAELVTTA